MNSAELLRALAASRPDRAEWLCEIADGLEGDWTYGGADGALKALTRWPSSAEMIADLARMGRYLRKDWPTLCPTWGQGVGWKIWRPDVLIGCDLEAQKSPVGFSVDFRDMPFRSNGFKVVVFDPPYKLNGTPSAADERYGVARVGTRFEREDTIRDGVRECWRVLEPEGWLLVKLQDQVNGGKMRWQSREVADLFESLGGRLVDRTIFPSYRKQPDGTTQQHLRQNFSQLLVLQKAK